MPYTRRNVIGATAMVPALLVSQPSSASQSETPYKEGFRFCMRCQCLFREGGDLGRCVDNLPHKAAGWYFRLFHIRSEQIIPPEQDRWGQCTGCRTIFYSGYQRQGVCPVYGSHRKARGEQFFIEHDRPVRAGEQADWRFCRKCMNMFFDSPEGPGRCVESGNHVKAGYNFILRYDRR